MVTSLSLQFLMPVGGRRDFIPAKNDLDHIEKLGRNQKV